MKLLLAVTFFLSFQVGASPEVAKILDEGLAADLYPGASVYVGSAERELFQYSVGDSHRTKLYDVASLTKVIVTTTLVMHFEERGVLSLKDKIRKHLPTFKGESTLEDLLRHRAGFPAGARPVAGESIAAYVNRILRAPLAYKPPTKFLYSDLSFILLGRIVELKAGRPLDELAEDILFRPLKMAQSRFDSAVHDPTAKHFAPHRVGHAGLFSTLDEVALFARMILNEGEVNGVRILSRETVKKMLTKVGLRGLGWDFESEYAEQPRGSVFPAGISFGHTGYTGTVIWIDPKSRTFYVLLSNRVASGDERTKKPFGALKKKLSTEIGKFIYLENKP